MSTWILRLDEAGTGPRLAIKDLIDVAGAPTTAGCRVLAEQARPAEADAACLAGLRATGAAIVGKANLHELAAGGTGVNPHFGTPTNPFDPALIPGGSSSGSAVALAEGEVDLALGSDTAGSIRTPSACCGTVGLKPTWGRVPLDGVWPLAPSLDCVGPMARDVAGVAAGLALLDPTIFGPLLDPGPRVADEVQPSPPPPHRWSRLTAEVVARLPEPTPVIGRVRLPDVDPAIDAAVDRLLAAAELEAVNVVLPGWDAAVEAGRLVMFRELWQVDGHLWERGAAAIGADVRERIEEGRQVTDVVYDASLAHRSAWRTELAAALARTPVLAWPTIAMFPPRIDDPVPNTRRTNVAVNLAGHPALALPVPTGGPLPASIQLMGADHTEPLLCATGLRLEAAARSMA